MMHRFISCSGLLAMLLGASAARGVILYGSADRNTDMPGSLSNRGPDGGTDAGGDPRDLLNSGWQYEGTFDTGAGNFLGTPIAANYFITAAHVQFGSTFVYQNNNYTVGSSSQISGTDLRVFQVTNRSFDTYAPLWDESTDGSEVGKKLVVIGRGTQRGAGVYVNGVLKGWQWGTDDHVQSWGTNVVSGIVDASSQGLGQVLYFNFDASGGANEAAISAGDSGGGVFLQAADGTWKLAGINYGVDSPWSLTDGGATFNADLFDYGGLYAYDATNGYQYLTSTGADQPGASYASLISANLTDIESITHASVITTPEPTTLEMFGTGILSLLSARKRRKPLSTLTQQEKNC